MELQETRDSTLLRSGTVLRKQALPSNNYTYLVELGDSSKSRCLAIYKPRKGEAPLWDFPSYTLYLREQLAFLVSESLGWGLVPLALIRDGPHGVGSMQRFIPAQPGIHYFNLPAGARTQLMRIAVFDCVVNNADRKGGHFLFDTNGRVWAIDHGLTFSPWPKLRTVMWDLENEAVDEELRERVAMLHEDNKLRQSLEEALADQEVEAFYRRVTLVAESPTLPMRYLCDPTRPSPWPSI